MRGGSACRNCGQAVFESAAGRWWHVDSQHAWCGFVYGATEKNRAMPYPIPDDQRAVPLIDGLAESKDER